MGEETDDPGRNIPRALAGTLMLTGVLFVVVMFAQVDRIRHRPGRARRVPEFRKHVGRLGQYLRRPVVRPGDHLHRDRVGVRLPPGHVGDVGPDALRVRARRLRPEGVGAHPRGHRRSAPRHLAGRRSSRWWSTSSAAPLGWPDMGTGNDAINTYFLFAVAGSVCLMVCYLLVEIAAAWFVGAPKFARRARRQGQGARSGAAAARRGGDRGGAVVQRQGRRNLAPLHRCSDCTGVSSDWSSPSRPRGIAKRVGESLLGRAQPEHAQ